MQYISGANGFIGSYLSKKLKLTSIPHEKLSTVKIKPFENFYFLSTYGNLADQTETDKIIQANLTDLIHILNEIDFSKGFQSFVFISTSSVRLKVQTLYSRTKKAAEQILLALKEKYHVPICIIRPTSVFGPHEQPIHLIPTILRSCFKGEEMNFVKDAVHDYIFVEDVVNGIINLSDNQAGGVYELGTGIPTTNQEVLNLIEKISGKKAKINVVSSMRSYDTYDWVCTNFRARSFGWLPKYTLEQGLIEVIEDYKKNPKIYEKKLL